MKQSAPGKFLWHAEKNELLFKNASKIPWKEISTTQKCVILIFDSENLHYKTASCNSKAYVFCQRTVGKHSMIRLLLINDLQINAKEEFVVFLHFLSDLKQNYYKFY